MQRYSTSIPPFPMKYMARQIRLSFPRSLLNCVSKRKEKEGKGKERKGTKERAEKKV
jgi:hypothetical protein